jgi:hypothetical protein
VRTPKVWTSKHSGVSLLTSTGKSCR